MSHKSPSKTSSYDNAVYVSGIPLPIPTVALSDVAAGLLKYRLWTFLGWQDIKQRYRRSVLGPLWLTLSTGFMVAAMSILYGRLFKMPMEIYAPFLASGVIIWSFISSILNDACSTFMSVDSLVKQVRMPLTVHACRMVWKNIIILLHNVIILIPVWLIFDQPVSVINLLLALTAILLIAINGLWMGIVLGILCARFRDIQQIIASLVQIVFFITPVMWLPSILEGRGLALWLIVANPFYHFLEIVRAPLLGSPLPTLSWWVAIGATALVTMFGLFILGRFRNRLPYWL